MSTCKQCGAPAPEGEDLCWCCKHTKLHPTDPKPEQEKTEQEQPEQHEDDLLDHYKAIRHEFYQVWESIDELREQVEKKHRMHRIVEFIKKRAKKWTQQLRWH